MAGDKQLAEEIEFDLRKFEERQKEEDEQKRRADREKILREKKMTHDTSLFVAPEPAIPGGSHEEDQNPAYDLPDLQPMEHDGVSAENNSEVIATVARDANNPADIETEEECDGVVTVESALKYVSPKKYTTKAKNNLLKAAVINSHLSSVHCKKLSILLEDINCNPLIQPSPKTSSAISRGAGTSAEADSSNIDVDVSVSVASNRDQVDSEERRQELLRAISTPTRNESIIKNITFINQTQEVSAIGIDTTHDNGQRIDISVEDTCVGSQQKLVLHLRSPDAFAKDDEFDRLRRDSKPAKRSLANTFRKEKETTNKKKSGGFMESYGTDETVEQNSAGMSTLNGTDTNDSLDVQQEKTETPTKNQEHVDLCPETRTKTADAPKNPVRERTKRK